MVVRKESMVQRDLHFAIIDEVDSVLIDEARTPLIISGSGSKSTDLYRVADLFVKQLKKGRILNEEEAMNPLMKEELQEEGDFILDEKAKSVVLTQEGIAKAEKFFNVDNLSDPENLELQHHINNALKANYNMHLDKDYVVHEGEIVIVDEFTGRMMTRQTLLRRSASGKSKLKKMYRYAGKAKHWLPSHSRTTSTNTTKNAV